MWVLFGKGYLQHPGSACSTHDMFEILSISDGVSVTCCLFLSTGSYHVSIQIHATCPCFP